ILHVTRPETALGFNLEAALVARLETEQGLFKAGQQAAIADLEGGGLFANGGINHIAAGQFQGEVQGDFGVLVDAGDIGHVSGLVLLGGVGVGTPPLPSWERVGERGKAVNPPSPSSARTYRQSSALPP